MHACMHAASEPSDHLTSSNPCNVARYLRCNAASVILPFSSAPGELQIQREKENPHAWFLTSSPSGIWQNNLPSLYGRCRSGMRTWQVASNESLRMRNSPGWLAIWQPKHCRAKLICFHNPVISAMRLVVYALYGANSTCTL